jgi:hypothetical protein
MANRFPLQRGDVAPDLSDYNASSEADRRSPDVTVVKSNPMYGHGENMAPQKDSPEGRIWKVGQAAPNDFLTAPYPVIRMDGDNNGSPAEVHEIDIYSYGDAYDQTAPIRVRTVDNYNMDTDFDGHRN